MREAQFRTFLETEGLTDKAINSRLVKGRKAETILNKSLDSIVSNDSEMKSALFALRENESVEHGLMQNVLRKYYKFENGKEFPRLKDAK